MADDGQNSNPPNPAEEAVKGLQSKLDSELGAVKDQLKAMNDAFASGMQQLATAMTPKQPQQQPRQQSGFTDADFLDPQALQGKVTNLAQDIASRALAREREMNATIYNLAQEYPEIQTDQKIKQAVVEAHKTLPAEMRDTAVGYETAVYRAVSKEGLQPKSKRQIVEDAPVASGGKGGGQGKPDKKAKVDPRSIEFARLLGRPVDDPNYVKELEKTTARSEDGTWGRYR